MLAWLNKHTCYIGIISLALLFSIGLVGCGKHQTAMPDERNKQQDIAKQTPSEQITTETQEKEHPKEAENEPSNELPETAKNQEYTTSLSNVKQGWGFKRNADHQTPGINSTTAALINKYQGVFVGSTHQKAAYLTFDEGYENGFTPRILDTLKANQVKAAFFITGDYLNRNPELVKRMVQEGHVVGNHSWSHPSLPDVSDTKLREEVQKLEREFLNVTGQKIAPYLRPPRGEYSERTLFLTQNLGYHSTFWSIAFKDWDTQNQPGADYSYNHVIENIHPGAVILLHAVSESNTQALDRIINGLRNEGYTLKPLNDLP